MCLLVCVRKLVDVGLLEAEANLKSKVSNQRDLFDCRRDLFDSKEICLIAHFAAQ